ncbi:MAG: hypothetical protein EOS25_15260 [Mesorhizobium sp.]|uniref:hypothetical protein n=1 Tax=Mesorhizobium sp. TaxID=1871066 RepID=UPI000FE9B9D4|nr:hypothetical protein [Mesorhizobium sp.]RWD52078.1 MAG: hypothetical protein EOS59_03950 [Mesorhizobium sp.]RWE59933.1 MAG: hypothetical protein EOS24_14330 [Mesorhizobium sp.]RWF10074.1 MAG: hypothetical protein EOS69_15830 [Mesorhizobium sp.]RWF17982.1 MAG: hypothetical protein EOS25_15260 [Mesorhizobium sp.]TIW48921.1 MAG: hypothetical protein E5V71_01870 [Mesorhizobium sp.]
MFSDVQISLYPRTGDFVGVDISALDALDPCRDRLRMGTGDISMLPVGRLQGHITIELTVSANSPAPR